MNRRSLNLLAIVSLVCLAWVTAGAQESLNVQCLNEYYHNWQCGVSDICVQGDYAFLACYNDGLRIINIADPDHIIEVSQLDSYDLDESYSIAISGNYVYVGSYRSGVNIIDVSNPSEPWEIGYVPFEGNKVSIRIFGQYAYVCMVNSQPGLTIIDISDPYNANRVCQLADIYDAGDVDVRGDTVYSASESQGLQVLDISDMANPRVIGNYSCGDGEWVNGVAVSSHYAYLACGGDGLRVIDLSSMQMVASIDSLYYGFRTSISGDYVYINYGDPNCPLAAVDVSNPLSPQTVGIYYPPANIINFTILEDRAFVADNTHGIRAVDISNPAAMHEDFAYSRTGIDLGVVVSGDYAYVREYFKLKIINIADLANPYEVGYFESSWNCRDYNLRGNIAYLLNSSDTALYAVDISNVATPTLLGSYTTPDDVHYTLGLYDHYAYITENYGIRILDITNPQSMTQVGYYNCELPRNILTVYDHYLIFNQVDHSVNVLDLTDPVNPAVIESFILEEYPYDAKVVGNLTYIVSPSYLWIYDNSDWTRISTTCLRDVFWCDARAVEIEGDYAFLAGELSALSIYNIADPLNPHLAGYYKTPDGAYGLAVSGDTVILAGITNLGFYEFMPTIGIDEPSGPVIPRTLRLMPNYPNPFNNATTIEYQLPYAAMVNCEVYDVGGRKVETITDAMQAAGHHQVTWNGSDKSSGIYFFRIQAGNYSETKKMLLLR